MRILVWLFRAFVFFTLFAFALNNQQLATIRWFFGVEWQSPMVIVVLIAFALGCVFGVLAMMPSWWRHWRVARTHAPAPAATTVAPPTEAPPTTLSPVTEVTLTHPPRDGL